MDKKMRAELELRLNYRIKGQYDASEPLRNPDMLTAMEISGLEEAVGHAPLTREELLEAADEMVRLVKASNDGVGA